MQDALNMSKNPGIIIKGRVTHLPTVSPHPPCQADEGHPKTPTPFRRLRQTVHKLVQHFKIQMSKNPYTCMS